MNAGDNFLVRRCTFDSRRRVPPYSGPKIVPALFFFNPICVYLSPSAIAAPRFEFNHLCIIMLIMNDITVATFNQRAEAEPLKQRFEAARIPAEIHDESTMEKVWFVREPLASIRLKVPSARYEESLQLLRAWDADGALRNAVRCPECGSSRIEYPQFTRKFFLPNILGLLSALGILQKEFYCDACQFTWPKAGHKISPTRPHMAPYYFIEGIPQTNPEPKRDARHEPGTQAS